MNCYSCGINLPNKSILWVESVNMEFVKGYTVNRDTREKIYQELPLRTIKSSDLHIKKYKGLYDYSFRNGFDFIIKDMTHYIAFKISLMSSIRKFNQLRFNKHPLQKKKRTEILKTLIEQHSSKKRRI